MIAAERILSRIHETPPDFQRNALERPARARMTGPVALRADKLQEGTWTPPSSFHSDLIRERPVGHLFNTITNGIRSMPGYADQIPADDRWAIIAYVRALQRSQKATLEDVPPEMRSKLR